MQNLNYKQSIYETEVLKKVRKMLLIGLGSLDFKMWRSDIFVMVFEVIMLMEHWSKML